MIKLYTPTIEAFMLEAVRAEEPVIYIHEYREHDSTDMISHYLCLNCMNDRRQIVEFIACVSFHLLSNKVKEKTARELSKEYRERIEAGLKKRNFTDVRPGYYSDASIFGELPVLKGIKK